MIINYKKYFQKNCFKGPVLSETETNQITTVPYLRSTDNFFCNLAILEAQKNKRKKQLSCKKENLKETNNYDFKFVDIGEMVKCTRICQV